MVGVKKLQAERGLAPRDDIKCSAGSPRPTHAQVGRGERRPVPTRDQDPSTEYPSISEGDPIYYQIQMGTRRELVSNLSVHLDNYSIYRIATGKQALPKGPFDILIIGDPIHKPPEIADIREVQTLEPGEEIFISIMCLDHPYWLPAGIPIAQAFLLSRDLLDIVPDNPTVLWVQIMKTRKPITKCYLFCKREKNQKEENDGHSGGCNTHCQV